MKSFPDRDLRAIDPIFVLLKGLKLPGLIRIHGDDAAGIIMEDDPFRHAVSRI